jgi:hypothetical protein
MLDNNLARFLSFFGHYRLLPISASLQCNLIYACVMTRNCSEKLYISVLLVAKFSTRQIMALDLWPFMMPDIVGFKPCFVV